MQNLPMSFNFRITLAFVLFCLSTTQSFSQGSKWREKFQNRPSVTRETPPAPDYSNIRSWASHPSIHDMGDSIPQPLRKGYSYDSTVDVFFIHPTTYLRKVND